jgi:signal transduction histidine kinase
MEIAIGIVTVILCIVLMTFAALLLASRSRSDDNSLLNSFIPLLFTMVLWAIVNFAAGYSNFIEVGTLLNRIVMALSVITFAQLLWFSCLFSIKSVRPIYGVYIAGAAITLSVFSLTPYVVAGVHAIDGVVAIDFGNGAPIYFVCILAMLLATMMVLLKGYISARKKTHHGVMFGAVAATAFLTVLTNAVLPVALGDYRFTSVGPLFGFILIAAVGYATIKHNLFDIKLAAIRSVAYGLLLLTLAGIYYAIAFFISIVIFHGEVSNSFSLSPLNILLALMLAFLFQPLKRFFDKLTNKLFYKEIYDSEEFFANLNHLIRSATSLNLLLKRSVELLSTTFKAETVAFFVYRNETRLTPVGSDGYKKMPLEDVHAFDGLRKPVYVDDSSLSTQLRRIMVSHRLAIAVPLYLNEKLIGLMCLGEHRVSHYTRRDLRVLRVAAGEIVVGVQNMLAIQEIRDLNENLQQRIDAATKELRRSNAQLQRLDEAKDEFISMASHQLRTPLTSIKGYIDMILDGDAGEVTPMQKKFLSEAFLSSERMVFLINDFLNVSRLQTGKFIIEKRPTDLAKVVEEELDSLQINASGRGLSFQLKTTKSVPKLLMIDEAKIRQVIMNFADNALYYSRESSVIKVTLTVVGDSVEMTVKDNGIGVPKAEQASLFSKFFRATNARKQRPDGTGVGLYLAKRVVAGHGGKILFSSIEGKGSTFGFSLPIEKLRVRDNADKLDN